MGDVEQREGGSRSGDHGLGAPWSRREFLRRAGRTAASGVLIGGAIDLLDACGSSSTSTGTSPSAAAVKQEITIGAAADQYVLSGPRASLGFYPLNTNVVETLTYLSANYQVQPMLAESWEFRSPNTWRFHLRKGVKFHDGTPMTAQAVKAGLFDRVAKVPGGSTILAGPDSAVVVDDYTIDYTPLKTNLRIPEQIVHPNNGVVAPGSDPGSKPVGTGPFRFVSYSSKESIVVERNPDYWGSKAKLDRMTFKFYPDAQSRLLALEAGNVDFVFDVARPSVADLKSRGFVVEQSIAGAYDVLYCNVHTKAPYDILQDMNVRMALEYGIDRKSLVSKVLYGQATNDQTMVPPAVLAPYASLVKGYAYDPTKSKSLLDSAGWTVGSDGIRQKGGRKLKLTLVSGFPSADEHRPTPTYLQSQFKDIGVDLAIVEQPDTASYQAKIDSGEGDLFAEIGNQNDANPGFLPVLIFYTGGGQGATASYQSRFAPGATFDSLLAPSLTSSDPDAVRKAVAQAMHEIIDNDAIVIPLVGVFRIYGMKKTVQNFVPHPSFLNVRWNNVSLSG